MAEFIDAARVTSEALEYPDNVKRTYTVEEIQKILGISHPTAYSIVKKNLFRTVKVGHQIRISKKSFDEWLDKETADGGAANG